MELQANSTVAEQVSPEHATGTASCPAAVRVPRHPLRARTSTASSFPSRPARPFDQPRGVGRCRQLQREREANAVHAKADRAGLEVCFAWHHAARLG